MKRKLPPSPVFDTSEEEDEFWQTHSPLDFEHEDVGTPAPRKFGRSAVKLTLRLSLQEQELLKRICPRLQDRDAQKFIS